MADDVDDEAASPAPSENPRAQQTPRIGDPRAYQRNLAERLFPGPSRQMSEQFAKHVENLLTEGNNEDAIKAWRERREQRSESNRTRRKSGGVPVTPGSPAVEAPKADAPAAVTADDFALLTEKLDQQNDLLKAILESQVDTQTDARSTAQNSRTFAWAGTAIGLLTLVATVIAVVEAIQGH
ncbi:MAG TPA: hypothetical protein VGF80_07730 [Galbitalea sp.]